MKKKLVVLLAAVMLFAFSANAYAATFSDVSDQSVIVQDAIKKTVALGIIEGYEDGTFGPDKTITRAEFAKIAVSAAGAEQTASMLEGNNSSFKDVKAGAWYTGWINASESLGIFLGDTNGNFRPNDTITNQEAITVMLRLLGYNDNLTGTWPVNYVTKANQLKLLDDVNIVANAAAKRGDIVVILDDLLDTWIVTYDKDTNEFVYKQTEISGSRNIRLIDDSFDGNFEDVEDFAKVEQVRDAASKTLTWSTGKSTFIIDEQTAVSYNGGTLFDLEHHQGKVYYVEDNNNKKYARFIEVDSYTVTTTDDVVYNNKDGNVKVTVKKTNYNVAPTRKESYDDKGVTKERIIDGIKSKDSYLTESDNGSTWTVTTADKESATTHVSYSNTILYFNDDDQVYRIANDKEYADRAYIVKAVNTNNVRLVGTNNKTVSMNDSDTLIYDGDKFISPSDLEVGDAIVEVRVGELYYKTNTITGELNSTDRSDARYKIDGKNYVAAPANLWLDDEYEDAGIATEDVVGNKITVLLNKDNTVAVALVDETSTGTTLYGVVCDNNQTNGTFDQKGTTGLTIFTEEGNRVYYDLDDDLITTSLDKDTIYGRLVAYKLNKDGEIKDLDLIISQNDDGTIKPDGDVNTAGLPIADGLGVKGNSFNLGLNNGEIEVKNNAYLVFGEDSLALASNVAIFEIDQNNNRIDVNLISRSALLSKSDFKPDPVYLNTGANQVERQFFAYDTNSAGAVKALAYTTASSNDLHYGIVDGWNYRSSDYQNSVTFKGDDNVYELKKPSTVPGGAGQLVSYELSGDDVTVKYAFKKNGTGIQTREVSGLTNGLISFKQSTTDGTYALGKMPVLRDYRQGASKKDWQANQVYEVMTDTNTLIYVIDATAGTYSEGSLSDISRGDYVYVPVIDSDGYADIVIVDEYGESKAAKDPKNLNGDLVPKNDQK